MALQPVNRRSVPEDVFEQIVAEVLSGEMQPGEALPSERRLAEVLGVSRPAVREALKRLTAAGLVEVRQGDATTVRDFRRHAGLDLLPRLLMRAGELDLSVVRSILETRLHNGPKVAELAARRRRPELAALLDDVMQKLADEDDPVEQQRHALTFWDHVVDGADSIAFRLMYNTLRATYEPALAALATVMADEVGRPAAYRELADAINAGDPAARQDRRAGPTRTRDHGAADRHRQPGGATMTTSTERPMRKGFTLADAGREFWKHPSPWMIGVTFVAALTARIIVGDWQVTDALVPLVMLALFPFFEWIIHVFILHWRPKHLGRLTIDPLLAREHRAHHVDPRSIPLIFIPWKSLLLGASADRCRLRCWHFRDLDMGLTYLVFIAALGFGYEWTHYLIHSDYKPKTRVYRAIWRNHRQPPLQERALLVHGDQLGHR